MNALPDNPSSSRLEWANRLIGDGFYIFPLQPGKKTPFDGISWKAIKSRDPAVVREWFKRRPDMNYAVVCDDEHVIIDIDNGVHTKNGVRKEGEKNFRDAENFDDGFPEESLLDSTFKVRTPKGGFHLYLECKRPYQISTSKIITDVDVRSRDGYVVGPGCHTNYLPDENTVEGTYEVVLNKPMAKVPQWLEVRLDGAGLSAQRADNAGTAAMPVDLPETIKRAEDWLKKREPAIQGHGGNDHTYATAAHLKDLGLSLEKCAEVIHSSEWNTRRCDPAWDWDELLELVHHVYKYGNRQIGAKGDAMAGIGEQDTRPITEIRAELLSGETWQQATDADEGIAMNANDPPIFRLSEFLARSVDVASVIPGWVPAFGVTGILAKRGEGKSVFMIDMALRIATGMPWNGISIPDDLACIYLCGEDDVGVQCQMEAWKLENGTCPEDERFLVASAVPNVMDHADVRRWANAISARFEGRRVVVFLDTWQRAASRGNQNDDRDMQNAFHNVEALARALNGCAVVAFHSPKYSADTILGSVVIENDTVCIIVIKKDGVSRTARVERIKGPGEGNTVQFDLKPLGLERQDRSGRELSGVVAKFRGDGMDAAQRELGRQHADEADRRRWAPIIRELLASAEKPLSMHGICSALSALGKDRSDLRRPCDTDFKARMKALFLNKPFAFPDGKSLEFAIVNPRLSVFQVSDTVEAMDDDVAASHPLSNADDENAQIQGLPTSFH